MCPHKRAFVLSDGLLGQDPNSSECSNSDKAKDAGDSIPKPTAAPWVSCPHHKRNFDLTSGDCKSDPALSIATFPVEVRNGVVHLQLPPAEELDAQLGTSRWKVKKGEGRVQEAQFAELDRKIGFVGIRGKKPGVKPTLNGAAGSKMKRPVELMAGGCGSAPDW
jgi:nitrite reductase (NAD(P)H)